MTQGVVGLNRPLWAVWAVAIWLAGCVLVPLPAPIRAATADAYVEQLALADATWCRRIVGDPRYLVGLTSSGAIPWGRPPRRPAWCPMPHGRCTGRRCARRGARRP